MMTQKRQTGRQTDRQTERQRDRDTNRSETSIKVASIHNR